jgi:hypothetical protein
LNSVEDWLEFCRQNPQNRGEMRVDGRADQVFSMFFPSKYLPLASPAWLAIERTECGMEGTLRGATCLLFCRHNLGWVIA